jgi:opacity protein-like surface antigen
MTRRILLTALCLVLLAVAAVPGRAQFYIGVQAGLSSEDVKVGEVKFDRDSAFLYGAQVGVRLSSFTIEGQFYRAEHDLLTSDDSPDMSQQLDYYFLGVNGKLGIPLAIVYPYITVGVGTYQANFKDIGKKSDLSYSVGAGAEVSLGKIGLFGELRYIDFKVELDNQSWDMGGLNAHVGLNFHF